MSRPRFATLLILSLFALLLPTVGGPAGAQSESFPATRLGTHDRLQTAVAASQVVFPDGAEVALLASADDFADALTASGLAGTLAAPLLYTAQGHLPGATADELRRLGVGRVVVLGGPLAIADGVLDAVGALGIDVDRVAGRNRFATAGAVAEHITAHAGPDGAFLTLGSYPDPVRAWADAVAVAPLAARTGSPILLTAPHQLPEETIDAIRSLDIDRITIIGGTAAVGVAVEAQLADLGVAVSRIGGGTRYETSLLVAHTLLEVGARPHEIWAATGTHFADALVGGPAAAAVGGVMLLTDDAGFDAQPFPAFLAEHRDDIDVVRVLGGPETISDATIARMTAVLAGEPPAGDAEDVEGVPVAPGQSLTELFDEHPPGTTFTFLPGVHLGVSVLVRSGDTYQGMEGAVLDGSRPLPVSVFRPEGPRWVADGITSDLATIGNYGCESWTTGSGQLARCGHEQEVYRSEQLFRDGVRQRHVNAVDQVDRPGTWHYDVQQGRVWMFDAPSGAEVRFSDTATAFAGYRTTDVTISGLAIRRYGSAAKHGAIDALDTQRWRITDVEVSQSHGFGIRIGEDTSVIDSTIIDNGQLGIGGDASDTTTTIVGNTIAGNGILGFQRNYEIGGVKIMHGDGVLIADNHVHDNAAKGLWLDGYNRNVEVRDNLVERSGQTGILYEISYDGRIHGNTLIDNHTDGSTTESYGSLQVVSSRDVEVFDNVMRGGGEQELTVYDTDLAPGVANVWVHHNDITIDTDWNEGTYGVKDLRADKGQPLQGLVFEHNTIRLVRTAAYPYAWDSRLIDRAGWSAIHPHDIFLDGG